MTERLALRLESFWTPASDGQALAYSLKLTNASKQALKDFRLCISGPARIDPAAAIEGATLVERLSNHAEFAPPAGFVLEPGAAWTLTARGLSYPLRHWTDGATGAYLVVDRVQDMFFVVLQNAPSGRLHVQVNVKKLIYDAFEK